MAADADVDAGAAAEGGPAWSAADSACCQIGNDREIGLTGGGTNGFGFVPVEFFKADGCLRL